MQNLNVNGYKPPVFKAVQGNNTPGQGVVPQSIPSGGTPNYSAAAYQGGFPKPKAR